MTAKNPRPDQPFGGTGGLCCLQASFHPAPLPPPPGPPAAAGQVCTRYVCLAVKARGVTTTTAEYLIMQHTTSLSLSLTD